MTALAAIPVNPPSEDLLAWVAEVTGARGLVARYPDPPGRSRDIWLMEGEGPDGGSFACVVRHEAGTGPWTGTNFTLAREGATLRALHGTGVPAPRVLGVSDDGDTLVIERLEGTANFEFPDEASRLKTIDAFLRAVVDLHHLPVDRLALPYPAPATAREQALLDLADYARTYRDCRQYPEMDAAFAWLEANAPTTTLRTSLLQGDTGPGNFLHLDGRITGLVDWEAAHVGDPMDDLAWLWFRKQILRKDTDLGYWYARYAALSGEAVDLRRIGYYRVQVMVRAATAVLNRQRYEPVWNEAKAQMITGLVRDALRDPFGDRGDPLALRPLTLDPEPSQNRS